MESTARPVALPVHRVVPKQREPMPSRPLWGLALLLALALVAVGSLGVGRVPLSLADLFHFGSSMVLGADTLDERRYGEIKNLLLEVRGPRILAAILIGASLSVSGAAFQALFMNPLVSPGLLGVLAGASFGAALAMVFYDQWLVVQVSAFAWGLLAVAMAIGIANIYRTNSLLMLVLGGIISGSLFVSLLSMVKYIADPYNQLPAIVYWLMGRLSGVDSQTVLTVSVPMLLGILVLIGLAKYLNVLSMGDEEARALGLSVNAIRYAVIGSATLISALTVALAGMIVWVGLVIPHIARMLVGADNERVLPTSALIGAIFLLIVDDLARSVFTVEIPIGIVTELIGIPVFIVALKNLRKGWS